MDGKTDWKVKYSVGLYKCRSLDNGPVSTETDIWMARLTGRLNTMADCTSVGHLTMVQLVLRVM